MERPAQVSPPEYMPPILTVEGDFISAKAEMKNRLRIIGQQNERLARKMDAAKFLDEAKRGLWNDPKVPSFQILKRSYDNQAFHFKDEKN